MHTGVRDRDPVGCYSRPVTLAVLLHFQPDWPFQDGTVIEAMAMSGRYRSQFETGTSNGGLTAFRGGDRWLWESRLFDARYDVGSATSRPVYGAVDLGDPHGAAPRFGSAFLRLRPDVSERATFCYPDSVFEPQGVVDAGGLSSLIESMMADDLDFLDRYVEAHVHGGVDLARDVEAIVLDPCFDGTAVHRAAGNIAPVAFHPGFRVNTDSLDLDYRGQQSVTLAQSLATELTPEVLGRAVRSGACDHQAMKRVWHLLARYGRARSDRGAAEVS